MYKRIISSRSVILVIISCCVLTSLRLRSCTSRSSARSTTTSSSSLHKRFSTSHMSFEQAIKFDNLNLRVLPVDSSYDRSSRQVKNAIFSRINPVPVIRPRTVAYSIPMLNKIGIKSIDEGEIAKYFSGNALFHGRFVLLY
jgi:hypothetical protein